MESTERVLAMWTLPQSLPKKSSSRLSGGDISTSIGLPRLSDQLSSFSERELSEAMMASTVNKRSWPRGFRWARRGRGMSVTANKAATDGDRDSGERTLFGTLRRGVLWRRTGWTASKCRLRLPGFGICTGLVGVVGRLVIVSVTVDIGEDNPCFPISASIAEGEGDSAWIGVTVIVIDDGLFLPSACFGLLACGGRMVTTDLIDLVDTVEMEMLDSAIVGFEERDSVDAGGRAEEREAVETVVVGKSAGVGVGGSLGRGVYSIMV